MKKSKRIKQILAWAGIILLVGMYLATFLLSFFKNPMAQALFRGSIACTVLVPILLFAFQLMYRVLERDDSGQKDLDKTDKPDPS